MQNVEKIYAERRTEVARLAKLTRITSSDVAGQHRHVQYAIACDHWAKCDQGARSVLLNAHPHVASTARISAAA